eukprot:g3021.t1
MFGNKLEYAEPGWYHGKPSLHYTKEHAEFRDRLRAFVDGKILPFIDDWIDVGEYPSRLDEEFFEEGLSRILFPAEYGGLNVDHFFELILWDELARAGAGVLTQLQIDCMALPLILRYANPELQRDIVPQVVLGKRHLSLAISEPFAGSDVAGIQTTAVREGSDYIVNGTKKWITGGARASHFVMLVRTGEGRAGLTLLIVDAASQGVTVRKMKTQFDNTSSTTFITLDNVRVPCRSRLGEEGAGLGAILLNFNHERWMIAIEATRNARTCFAEAFSEALRRKTFGKTLHEHQVIRVKLAEMARQIVALEAQLENVTHMFSVLEDKDMGGLCALLKVNASRVFEFCAREASQIFGGSSIVSEGRGKTVERLYRAVRARAIPGGSEEILLDLAARQMIRGAKARL